MGCQDDVQAEGASGRSALGPFILNPLSRPFSGAWNKGIMSCAVSRCFLRHFRIIWSFQGHFWVMHGAYHKRHVDNHASSKRGQVNYNK